MRYFVGAILAVAILAVGADVVRAHGDTPLDQLDRYQLALKAEMPGLDFMMNSNPTAVVVRVWCTSEQERLKVQTIANRFPNIHVIHVIEVGGACAK